MSIKNKLSSSLLKKSDSYNHYKNESEKLSKDLEQELKKLKKEFETYKRNNDKINESNNYLLNNLFTDYELKPKGALKYMQDLYIDLLDFYVNICEKHDLKYWLDYGNLLGAVRHGGFIPWDDDVDIGMMRTECIKFNEIIDMEVKNYGLDDIISISKRRSIGNNRSLGFTQITIRENGSLYAGLDIFPCDYIINPTEDTEKQFKKAKKDYFKNLDDGMKKQEVIDIFYNELGCSYDKQEFFLPSVEGEAGTRAYPLKIFKTDKVFPLKTIKYGKKYYSCPNDTKYYLTELFGNEYMKIPPTIRHHTRIPHLKNQAGYEENFKRFSERLKAVNNQF